MRNSSLSLVLVVLAAAATVGVVEGCTAEGSEAKTFGPSFDLDGGREGSATPDDGGGSTSSSSSSSSSSGGGDGGPTDGGSDGGSSGDGGGACAAGRVAIVSGGAAAQGSVLGPAGWTTAALAGGSVKGPPAVVHTGTAFHAVLRDSADALQATTFGATWSALGRVGSKTGRDALGLAMVGTTTHLVYQDSALYTYFHGTNAGAGWDAATDAVSFGGNQSFGPVGPGLVATGTELVVVNGGSAEGALYVQSFTGGAWAAATAIAGTAVCGRSGCGGAPAAIATAGTNDLLVLHIDKDTTNLVASVRSAATKAWTVQGPIRPAAPIATTAEAPSLALATATRAVAVFRGTDQKAYASLGDLTQTPIAWSAPTALSSSTVSTPPVAARGACDADAFVALVSGGEVKVVRLRGTAWSAPETVSGTTGASFAGIASNGLK